MAKIQGLAATAMRKSAGKLTFRNTIYGNVASQKIVNMTNPQSEYQAKTRATTKMVTKGYSMLKKIANHSIEGIPQGAKSMNEWKRLNSAANSNPAKESLYYYDKNSPADLVMPYYGILSQGTLTNGIRINPDSLVINTTDKTCFFATNVSLTNIASITYAELLKLIGYEKGDQMSFIFEHVAGLEEFMSDYPKIYTDCDASRFTFSLTAADTTVAFMADATKTGVYHFNPLIISESNTNVEWISFKVEGENNILRVQSEYVPAATGCIVRSSKVNGAWKRSTEYIYYQNESETKIQDKLNEISIFPKYMDAVETYQKTAAFLNNAKS